jgi:prepilin-type N-terminal cleavage/methylation domain-containing protein
MRVARAFTLIEVAVVLAILGLAATLAVPVFRDFAAHYRAAEAFRSAWRAVGNGRALAQRENIPVRVSFLPSSIVIEKANCARPDNGQADPECDDPVTVESIRRPVTGFGSARTTPLVGVKVTSVQTLDAAGAVTATSGPGTSGAAVVFCPSSDNYFRDSTTSVPLCGSQALSSKELKVILQASGETQHVRVRSALGAVDLVAGG